MDACCQTESSGRTQIGRATRPGWVEDAGQRSPAMSKMLNLDVQLGLKMDPTISDYRSRLPAWTLGSQFATFLAVAALHAKDASAINASCKAISLTAN